jgi:hypothetical protein
VVRGCPKGLGTPVFDKLEAELAKAVMSLPATKVREGQAHLLGPGHGRAMGGGACCCALPSSLPLPLVPSCCPCCAVQRSVLSL